jgi:P pilus assembly chaperone PapD
MQRRHLLTFILMLGCLFATAQQFAIQPGTLSFNVEPGKTQTQTLRIANTSAKKIAFQAYLGDWLRDSTGAHAYYRPDTLKRSCASWVTLSKNFVELQPNQVEELLVTITGPNNPELFKQMRWAMLFVQTVEEQDVVAGKPKEMKTQIKESIRAGIHIYQTPPNLTKAMAQALFLRPSKDKNTYEFGVFNMGDVQLQCKANLSLTNTKTGEEIKLDKVEFPMFPEGKRVIKFTLPEKLEKGTYSALAVLDFGEDQELQAIEKTIAIK